LICTVTDEFSVVTWDNSKP